MGYEAPAASHTEPVEDWLHDFDVFDPGYVRDPFPVWNEVRGCPVLTTERWGGVHLVVGYHAVVQAAANTAALTSTLGTSAAPTLEDHRDPNRAQSIINNDPPEHTPIRRTILPTFAPQAVAGYEPTTRALCESLADKIAARLHDGVGLANAAVEYSQQIPARVIGAFSVSQSHVPMSSSSGCVPFLKPESRNPRSVSKRSKTWATTSQRRLPSDAAHLGKI